MNLVKVYSQPASSASRSLPSRRSQDRTRWTRSSQLPARTLRGTLLRSLPDCLNNTRSSSSVWRVVVRDMKSSASLDICLPPVRACIFEYHIVHRSSTCLFWCEDPPVPGKRYVSILAAMNHMWSRGTIVSSYMDSVAFRISDRLNTLIACRFEGSSCRTRIWSSREYKYALYPN